MAPAPRDRGECSRALLEFVARRGDRRPQHPLRLRVPRRRARRATATRASPNRRVDTIGLARRLVRDDVPNLRLHTLATHFRTATEPVHRAYADAAATAEVFHALLEQRGDVRRARPRRPRRAAQDPRPLRRPPSSRSRLGSRASPASIVFRDRAARVLYVGKATNLRADVRALLLRRRTGGRFRSCCARRRASSTACARVRSKRRSRAAAAIQRLRPRFNRSSQADRQPCTSS